MLLLLKIHSSISKCPLKRQLRHRLSTPLLLTAFDAGIVPLYRSPLYTLDLERNRLFSRSSHALEINSIQKSCTWPALENHGQQVRDGTSSSFPRANGFMTYFPASHDQIDRDPRLEFQPLRAIRLRFLRLASRLIHMP